MMIASTSIPVNNPPRLSLIHNPQLMTALADALHRSRVRQREHLPTLQSPEKDSGFEPCIGEKGGVLTSEWSNGQTEGQVNRLKLIKRQMYGRANFDLLRQRVLHAV